MIATIRKVYNVMTKKKVNVSNDQEIAQSERHFPSENRGEKNKQTIRYYTVGIYLSIFKLQFKKQNLITFIKRKTEINIVLAFILTCVYVTMK